MKKLFLIAVVLMSIFSSSAQKNNYVTFQAEIANRNGDKIYFISVVSAAVKTIKTIEVDKNGVFKDTLSVEMGTYFLSDGKQNIAVYLKNGFDLHMKMDAKNFNESVVYKGKGAAENNFLVQSQNTMQAKMVDFSSLFEGNEDVFYKRLDEVKMDYLKLLEENKKLDPVFVDFQKKNLEEGIKAISEEYKKNREAFLAKNKLNNTVSPSFEYVNHKGGKTKLEDFKGKYVYIDLWATWCGPCRAEIPFLQKTEEEYHDKNIVFVSISIDKQIDFEKWKAFVTTQNLGGIQLIAEKDWSSEFVRNFGIKSIPRFILIDPKGIVVKGDAPRPSNPKLKEELDKLLN